MSVNAVVDGTYSDFKLVKTRSVFQMVIEGPIERAAEAIAMFGVPQPGAEIHVAIARIQMPAKGEVSRAEPRVEQDSGAPKVDTKDKSEAARERFKQLGSPEQMVAKCAMLCGDEKFAVWLERHLKFSPGRIGDAETCADFLRLALGIKSRTELASNLEAQRRWLAMVTDYDIWRGALPEKR